MSYLFKVLCSRNMMCQIEWVFRIYLFENCRALWDCSGSSQHIVLGSLIWASFSFVEEQQKHQGKVSIKLSLAWSYLLVKWKASLLQFNICNFILPLLLFLYSVSYWQCHFHTLLCGVFCAWMRRGFIYFLLLFSVILYQNLLYHMVPCSIKWKHETFG